MVTHVEQKILHGCRLKDIYNKEKARAVKVW